MDLETIINKYNNLITKYNDLINTKKNEENKKINNYTLNNFRNKMAERTEVSTLNNSSEKNTTKISIYKNSNKNKNKIKNLLIQGNINAKNINSFDNDYINHLKKENERLKKLIITYENSNSNNNKNKFPNILKKRNYLINNKIKRISEKSKKNSISKNYSKDNSYTINAYNNKNLEKSQNQINLNNKSSILFLMKKNNLNSGGQKNIPSDYSIITDTSLTITKKKISEIPKKIKNYNTININNLNNGYKSTLKKNNTNINGTTGRLNKKINNNIINLNNYTMNANKRIIKKLKDKNNEALKNENKNLSKDKYLLIIINIHLKMF